jgi:hypothetical protein
MQGWTFDGNFGIKKAPARLPRRFPNLRSDCAAAGDEGDQPDYQEYKEKDLGDAGGGTRNSSKPKDSGDQRDDQEY